MPFLSLNGWLVENASSPVTIVILFLGKEAERYGEIKLLFEGCTGKYRDVLMGDI